MTHGICAIGNAIVDVLADADDETIMAAQISRGGMTLVDAEKAAAIYGILGPAREVSGGSAANTAQSFASLGGKAAYIGKTGADALGDIFIHDIRTQGIVFDAPQTETATTGVCMVMVTKDGERSMATHLGACRELTEDDVLASQDLIATSRRVFLEGYLWDAPSSHLAALKAIEIAATSNVPVALTLSDPACVTRWHNAFQQLVMSGQVSLVFANEKEFAAMWPTLDEVTRPAGLDDSVTLVVTRGAKGCRILTAGETIDIAARPVEAVVDTTGAGDMFAGGYLFGMDMTGDPRKAGEIAAIMAASIIQRFGAQPDLSETDHGAIKTILLAEAA